MNPTFEVIDLRKARPKGGKYVAIYLVHPKTGGKPYERRFYNERAVFTFLKNAVRHGLHVERIDMHGSVAPHQRQTIEDPASQVITSRIASFDPKKRPLFLRTGDRLKRLDPSGAEAQSRLSRLFVKERGSAVTNKFREAAVRFREKAARLRLLSIKAEQSKQKTASEGYKIRAELFTRLADKYSKFSDSVITEALNSNTGAVRARIQAIKTEIARLSDRGAKELLLYPNILAIWEKNAARAKRRKGTIPDQPRGLPKTEQAIITLEMKLRGIKGDSVMVRRNQPKITKEPGYTKIATVEDAAGLDYQMYPASYALSVGRWPTTDESGRPSFSKVETQALLSEFQGDIDRIINGKVWREGQVKGWIQMLGEKSGFKRDLQNSAVQILLERAKAYTSSFAREMLAEGVNFKRYAIRYLQEELRSRLRDMAQSRGRLDLLPDIDAALNPEGDLTAQQIKDLHVPIGVHYLSPDDVVALKDFQKLLSTKLRKVEAIALMSRLNLHNVSDNPKGGAGGLKSWDEVSEDLAEATNTKPDFWKRGNTVQKLFRKVVRGIRGVATNLTEEDRSALAEGLKILQKVYIHRTHVVPEDVDYAVTDVPSSRSPGRSVRVSRFHTILRKLSPKRRGDRQLYEKLLSRMSVSGSIAPFKGNEVSRFWASRSKHAEEFGIDLTHTVHLLKPVGHKDPVRRQPVTRQENVTVPMAVRHREIQAHSYKEAWENLRKLPLGRMKDLASTREFKSWEKKYALATTNPEFEPHEVDPKSKEPIGSSSAVVPWFSYGKISFPGVTPTHLKRLTEIVADERESKLVKKSISKDIFLAFERYFGVA